MLKKYLELIKPRFWTLSIVTGYKNTTFRELALLPSSGKRGGPGVLGWVLGVQFGGFIFISPSGLRFRLLYISF
jgi:hypothetical protein